MGLKKTELSFRFTTTKCLDLNAAVLYLAVSLTTRPTPTGYRLVLTEQKGEMFELVLGPFLYLLPIGEYARFRPIHNLGADLHLPQNYIALNFPRCYFGLVFWLH